MICTQLDGRALLAVQNLASLVAVAFLVAPTHRNSLVLLREHLGTLERSDLFEMALAADGVRGLSRQRVQRYLDQAVVAFDRALEVRRTRRRPSTSRCESICVPIC